MEAFVLGRFEPCRGLEALSALKNLKAVEYAHFVLGSYDFVAKISIKDLKELEKAVFEIRRISGVERTKTIFARE